MQQSSQSLNPWLLSYIEQQRSKQSRYKIDKYLLDSGCDPAEIELVWQFFEAPPPIKTASFFKKNQKEKLFVTLGFLLLFVLPFIIRANFPSFDLIFWFIATSFAVLIAMLLFGFKNKQYRTIWIALWGLGVLAVWLLLPLNNSIKMPLLVLGNMGTVIVAGIYDGKNK
jgi:hypothetical protein